jgi:hypothetical protein
MLLAAAKIAQRSAAMISAARAQGRDITDAELAELKGARDAAIEELLK